MNFCLVIWEINTVVCGILRPVLWRLLYEGQVIIEMCWKWSDLPHTTRPACIYIRNLGHSTFPLPQRMSGRRCSFYLQWRVCSCAYCRIVWRTWTTSRGSAKDDLEIQIMSSSFSRVQVRWVKHSRWVPGGTWRESYVTWSRVTSWRCNAAWHQARAWQEQKPVDELCHLLNLEQAHASWTIRAIVWKYMDRPRQAQRVAERAGEPITVFSDEVSKFLAESAKNELRWG